MKYAKYHGLGNDYIVLRQSDLNAPLTRENIITICHRNYGVGSDGILLLEAVTDTGFIVRIYNPDGSEGENSGNGMRIMARYLYDIGLVKDQPFAMFVKGERKIGAQVVDRLDRIVVEMGKASFFSKEIPVAGIEREVLNEKITILDEELTFSSVSVGNPHCVVLGRKDLKGDTLRFGPLLEIDSRFPAKTNVQFAEVLDRQNVRLQVWERGAGYTLASGSSASAVASVARRLGLVDEAVTVHMSGGTLLIELDPQFAIKLSGPVTHVADGVLSSEIFAWKYGSDEAC